MDEKNTGKRGAGDEVLERNQRSASEKDIIISALINLLKLNQTNIRGVFENHMLFLKSIVSGTDSDGQLDFNGNIRKAVEFISTYSAGYTTIVGNDNKYLVLYVSGHGELLTEDTTKPGYALIRVDTQIINVWKAFFLKINNREPLDEEIKEFEDYLGTCTHIKQVECSQMGIFSSGLPITDKMIQQGTIGTRSTEYPKDLSTRAEEQYIIGEVIKQIKSQNIVIDDNIMQLIIYFTRYLLRGGFNSRYKNISDEGNTTWYTDMQSLVNRNASWQSYNITPGELDNTIASMPSEDEPLEMNAKYGVHIKLDGDTIPKPLQQNMMSIKGLEYIALQHPTINDDNPKMKMAHASLVFLHERRETSLAHLLMIGHALEQRVVAYNPACQTYTNEAHVRKVRSGLHNTGLEATKMPEILAGKQGLSSSQPQLGDEEEEEEEEEKKEEETTIGRWFSSWPWRKGGNRFTKKYSQRNKMARRTRKKSGRRTSRRRKRNNPNHRRRTRRRRTR